MSQNRKKERKGWLISCKAYAIIGATLESIDFAQKSVHHGTTYYGQNITRYNFNNELLLTTQTNFGEIPSAQSIAYYTLEKKPVLKIISR